jgi:sugar lactone lactonase YvrE
VLACAAVAQAATFQSYQAANVVLGQFEFTLRDYTYCENGMAAPEGVAVDPTTGKVFVSQSGSNCILRFASPLAVSSGAAAEAVLGQPDFYSWKANQGGSTPAANTLSHPAGLAVDSTGTLWVADKGNNRVLRFDNASTIATNALASVVFGQSNFTSNTPALSQTGMNSPSGVSITSQGYLWVADTGNHRVLGFSYAAARGNGALADDVLGQPYYTVGTSGTSSSQMWGPEAVYADKNGRVWVSDTEAGRVLLFTSLPHPAHGPAAKLVLGKPDFTTSTSNTSGAETLNHPSGLVLDDNGTLWVADYGHNRVSGFSSAYYRPSGSAADTELGQPNFEILTSATTSRTLWGPKGLALDSAGGLWVADRLNNRALHFGNEVVPDPTPTPSPTPTPTATPSPTPSAPSRQPTGTLSLALSIQGNLKKITVSKPAFTLTGTANATNGTLARVEVKVGTATYKPASGTTSWKFTAKLQPGRNVILVRAVVVTGAMSATKQVVVVRKQVIGF